MDARGFPPGGLRFRHLAQAESPALRGFCVSGRFRMQGIMLPDHFRMLNATSVSQRHLVCSITTLGARVEDWADIPHDA